MGYKAEVQRLWQKHAWIEKRLQETHSLAGVETRNEVRRRKMQAHNSKEQET